MRFVECAVCFFDVIGNFSTTKVYNDRATVGFVTTEVGFERATVCFVMTTVRLEMHEVHFDNANFVERTEIRT